MLFNSFTYNKVRILVFAFLLRYFRYTFAKYKGSKSAGSKTMRMYTKFRTLGSPRSCGITRLFGGKFSNGYVDPQKFRFTFVIVV